VTREVNNNAFTCDDMIVTFFVWSSEKSDF